jgi:hypothetical protein
MVYYPMSEYKLLGYQRSSRNGKKYDAIIKNKSTGRTVRVPFGATGYETFKDDTGLSLYKTHRDAARRKSYIARHKGFIRQGFYSPGYFSLKILW